MKAIRLKIIIEILSFVALTLSFSSCRQTELGVWEVYRDSGIFICSPEDADYSFGGKDKVYWLDKSCEDLGYTSKGSSEGSWHFTSPDGETTPGRNGAFWDKYGGSQSGVSCDASNYAGPEFDIQIDGQCKAAYAYKCAGNQTGVEAACSIYKDFQRQDSSIPNCPYCNYS